jgi:phosphate-selective porin OprO and OprP
MVVPEPARAPTEQAAAPSSDVLPPEAPSAPSALGSQEPFKATAPALSTPTSSPQAASAAPAPPQAQVVSMGPKGLTVQSDDARFSFNLRFPFMFDAKATLNNDLPKGGDAFFPRFFGPIFTVTLYKAVTGKLIVGFMDQSVTVVNAWMDIAAHPLLHLKLGKFLYPISLERQVLPLRIAMLEHGIASSLLPASEFGAQLWGASADKLFEYQLTFGNGTPTNARTEIDLDDAKEGIARVYLRPFARTAIAGLNNLGFGIGATYGRRDEQPVNTTIRTLGARPFFVTNAPDATAGTVLADGDVVRLVPQVGYTGGPFSVFAEYIRTSEELTRGSAKDTLTHQSAQALATLVLTGENAVLLDILSPQRPFDLSAGQFGALELVARGEYIEFDADTFPTYANPARSAQSAWAVGGGFNWVPTEIIRVMVNYEHTEFGAAKGAKKQRAENLLGLRVQALF